MSSFFFGFLFGLILQYARLNCFDTIVGMALLRNFSMAKTMGFAVGLGILLFAVETRSGWGSYHVKPLILSGLIVGGLLFGAGMAILGYCPGTIAISLGQGRLDALVGILGGLCGSLLFASIFPVLSPWLGPNWGALSLSGEIHSSGWYWTVVLGLGLGLIGFALWLQRHEGGSWRWLLAAIGLPLLNVAVNLPALAGHPIGASTAFPWLAMNLTQLGSPAYWTIISAPGAWEFTFLTGAFCSGLLISVASRRFQCTMVPPLWQTIHGDNAWRRVIWSFIGGALLLFGARMAGGCTSGHILSGGMQLALSSLLFAGVVFLAFLTTGRWFHRSPQT